MKKAAELKTLFATMLAEGNELVTAQRCTLFLIDEKNNDYLWSKSGSGGDPTEEEMQHTFDTYDQGKNGAITLSELSFALEKLGVHVRLSQLEDTVRKLSKSGKPELNFEEFKDYIRNQVLTQEVRIKLRHGGTKHYVATTGETLNIPDVFKDPRANPEKYKFKYKSFPKNLLIAPVKDEAGKVIGLIEMVNKQGANPAAEGSTGSTTTTTTKTITTTAFTKDDEKLIRMLCSHAAVFIGQVSQAD